MTRQIIILAALTLCISTGLAQTAIDPNKAGENISKNLKLPTRKESGNKELSGVYTFVVELNGTVSTIDVKDSIGFGIDEQIIKRLSEVKGWKVFEYEGEPKRISYKLPIRIKLPKKQERF